MAPLVHTCLELIAALAPDTAPSHDVVSVWDWIHPALDFLRSSPPLPEGLLSIPLLGGLLSGSYLFLGVKLVVLWALYQAFRRWQSRRRRKGPRSAGVRRPGHFSGSKRGAPLASADAVEISAGAKPEERVARVEPAGDGAVGEPDAQGDAALLRGPAGTRLGVPATRLGVAEGAKGGGQEEAVQDPHRAKTKPLGDLLQEQPLESLVTVPRVGRFEMIRELGRGGMGVVMHARDTELNREVALKFMAEDLASNKKMLGLFQREARAAAGLTHRNIVKIFDIGQQDGRPYICMEYLQGETLEELLEQHGHLDVDTCIGVALQLSGALEYAHGKKILHRDIKPANVMINGGTHEVTLMDFGLANIFERKDKTTMITGTPEYMAPEQFAGKGLDGRTDLFSLGVMMYQMLGGTMPFVGGLRSSPAARLRELELGIPDALDRLVSGLLELDQDRRPSSASVVRLELQSMVRR